jgi:uncharacterized protein YdaU (DUF1376 family)
MFVSDWLGSNRRALMTLEQQGAYMNLLCRQWADPDCSLPDDDNALARLSEMGEGWLKGGCHLVRKCFPKHPTQSGRIANARLLEIRAERDRWTQKSSEGGKKSAKARRAKAARTRSCGNAGGTKGGATTLGTKHPTKRQPNGNLPSPSPHPLSNNPLTPLPPELDSEPFRGAWSEWLAYRTEDKKKPATPRSQEMQLKKLAKIGPARAVAAIEHSIANGWQGIFEEDDKSAGRKTTARRSGAIASESIPDRSWKGSRADAEKAGAATTGAGAQNGNG